MVAKITLKDFIEKYTEFLKKASKDELVIILSAMASNIKPDKRQDFLDTLFLPKQKPNTLEPNKLDQHGAEILGEIESVKDEIIEKTKEEPDWEYYQDDEDRISGYEEFVEPLSKMMLEVNYIFDSGYYEIARKAYSELFTIDVEDDYGHGISIYDIGDVDLNEARARYLRSIYLTEKPYTRASILLDTMVMLDKLDFKERPKLNDIINISAETLPDFSSFLTKWIAATQDDSKLQHDAWNREATMLMYGISGLEALAKKEGNKRPRVYLDWINALIGEKNYIAALKAIGDALKAISPSKPIRAAIADLMVYCGQKLNDKKIQFDGTWISFEAKPDIFKLTYLYEQCGEEDLLPRMCKASEIIELSIRREKKHNYERSWERDDLDTLSMPDESLLLHSYLWSNQIEQAFELAKKGESLGWSSSSNPKPIFVAYFLVLSTKKPLDQLPIALRKFWCYALEISLGFVWSYDKNKNELFQRIDKIYQKLFLRACPYDEKIIKWCLIESEKRIVAIVDSQHRRAYERAALLTVACSEALGLIDGALATAFFDKIRNSFLRHRAFQAALKAAGSK